tara:strand:+ start:2851 stop:3324 length:474 start_codon:yes stop_codon:yes gene_type:complete
MKTIIFTIVVLISSSAYAQKSIKVIELKSSNAEAVTNVLDVLQDDKDKRPSMEKMAEAMFKRMDADKNGSLSLKEFQSFYARMRSSRSDRSGRPDSSDRGRSDRGRSDRGGSDRSDRGRSDRGGSDRSKDDDSRRGTQGFGKDKQDDSKGGSKSRGG